MTSQKTITISDSKGVLSPKERLLLGIKKFWDVASPFVHVFLMIIFPPYLIFFMVQYVRKEWPSIRFQAQLLALMLADKRGYSDDEQAKLYSDIQEYYDLQDERKKNGVKVLSNNWYRSSVFWFFAVVIQMILWLVFVPAPVWLHIVWVVGSVVASVFIPIKNYTEAIQEDVSSQDRKE